MPYYGRWLIKKLTLVAHSKLIMGCSQGSLLREMNEDLREVTKIVLKSAERSESRIGTSRTAPETEIDTDLSSPCPSS